MHLKHRTVPQADPGRKEKERAGGKLGILSGLIWSLFLDL